MFHICRTIRRHFSLRQVKLCIGQRNYKQKFTTHRPTKRVNSRSIPKLLFRILQNSRKKKCTSHLLLCRGISMSRCGKAPYRIWTRDPLWLGQAQLGRNSPVPSWWISPAWESKRAFCRGRMSPHVVNVSENCDKLFYGRCSCLGKKQRAK